MMPASGCCSWEATSASRIYGTKLKNLLMGEVHLTTHIKDRTEKNVLMTVIFHAGMSL